MSTAPDDLIRRLLAVVHQVQTELGREAHGDADTSFADMLDSMGLVEYLLVVGAELGLSVGEVEQCVERRFTTVAALARALCERGLVHRDAPPSMPAEAAHAAASSAAATCWLAATSVRLPQAVQSAAEIDALLQRPSGWWQSHAGIHQRRLWRNEDPLTAAAAAGRDCVTQAGLMLDDVDVVLVTSEAPPLLVGLGAALHDELGVPSTTAALEVGGACTGFLSALWLGRALLVHHRAVLIVAVEAPSRLLDVSPGRAGEAAALFGDGAAACLLCRERCQAQARQAQARQAQALAVRDVVLGADGRQRDLVQVRRTAGAVAVQLQGTRLAGAAIGALTRVIQELADKTGAAVDDLAAIVMHGGNGRFAELLARQLGLPPGRIWSQTAQTGNLGSASLPVAWAAQAPPAGSVLWAAVGAGSTWGAALFDPAHRA